MGTMSDKGSDWEAVFFLKYIIGDIRQQDSGGGQVLSV